MTEAEWLSDADPAAMLRFVTEKKRPSSPRRLRLFACRCVRRVWNDVIRYELEYCMTLAEAERFAEEPDALPGRADLGRVDGRGDNFALDAAVAAARAVAGDDPAVITGHALQAAEHVRSCIWSYTRIEAKDYEERYGIQQANDAAELARQCESIRDLFGNPFRRIISKQRWLKPRLVEFARMLYDRRAFDCLPGLADMLASYGCENSEILEHCRHPGEHGPGCWVMDLLLGRGQ